jgi:hypothetical protein
VVFAPFVELSGEEGCAAITAIVMDMPGPFGDESANPLSTRRRRLRSLSCRRRQFGREMTHRVRVDETNHIARAAGSESGPHPRPAARDQGTRWSLLRNRAHLTIQPDFGRLRIKQ